MALVLLLLRIVNSPFGSVLMAIRENPFRAEAIGYRTVVYRTSRAASPPRLAALAGALLALWSSQTNPDTTLSFDIMVDILLMVVIGGMGTMYGAVIGAVLLVFAQNYLQDLLAVANKALAGLPLLANFFHPDRWLLWLGVAFILCVYFFPTGIVVAAAGYLDGMHGRSGADRRNSRTHSNCRDCMPGRRHLAGP